MEFPVYLLVHRANCRAALLRGSPTAALALYRTEAAASRAAEEHGEEKPVVIKLTSAAQLKSWLNTVQSGEVRWGVERTPSGLRWAGREPTRTFMMRLQAQISEEREANPTEAAGRHA